VADFHHATVSQEALHCHGRMGSSARLCEIDFVQLWLFHRSSSSNLTDGFAIRVL
jgi:hypothetical protein